MPLTCFIGPALGGGSFLGCRGKLTGGRGGRTLETLTAPFRSPLRARVERRPVLANIIGKLDRIRKVNRDRGDGGMWFDLGVGGRKGFSRRSHECRENPEFPKWADADWPRSRGLFSCEPMHRHQWKFRPVSAFEPAVRARLHSSFAAAQAIVPV